MNQNQYEEYIVEDQGDDDFDGKTDQIIKQHTQIRKDPTRPESKHGRIQSGKSKQQEEEDVQRFQQQRMNEYNKGSQTLERMNKYINFHHTSLENFWKSNSLLVTMQQFIEFLYQISFNVSEEDIQELEHDLNDEQGYVTLQLLCEKINVWNNQENAMAEFIRERALDMAQNSKKKAQQQFKISKQEKLRPKTATYSAGRPVSGISQKSAKSKISGISDLANFQAEQRPPVSNKSKQYLQKHKEREKETERLLELTINKGKNEYEYEMLIKMGDANELSQLMNSKITYRAYKGAQGTLFVNVFEVDKFVKQMTLEEFQREYTTLKNKYNESRNLDFWVVLSQNKKQKNEKHLQKGSNFDKDQEIEQDSKKGQKKYRQQELKKVLLDTMVLTNLLKEQLAILNKKGINMYHNQGQVNPSQTIQNRSSQNITNNPSH